LRDFITLTTSPIAINDIEEVGMINNELRLDINNDQSYKSIIIKYIDKIIMIDLQKQHIQIICMD